MVLNTGLKNNRDQRRRFDMCHACTGHGVVDIEQDKKIKKDDNDFTFLDVVDPTDKDEHQ